MTIDTSAEAVERLAASVADLADGRVRYEMPADHVSSELADAAATLRALAAERDRLREALARIVRANDSYMDAIQDQVTAGNMRRDPLGEAVEATRAALAHHLARAVEEVASDER